MKAFNTRKEGRGFTLIELLVVIAIIGILSAVVLASLSTARNKGNDAAVQSNLATIQVQAEIYYGSNSNSYGNQSFQYGAYSLCTTGMFSDPNITAALKSADSANGSATGQVVDCYAYGTGYIVASALTATANTYQCLDSTGKSETVTGATLPTALTAFPKNSSNNYVCP